jgi:hypothetical protein
MTEAIMEAVDELVQARWLARHGEALAGGEKKMIEAFDWLAIRVAELIYDANKNDKKGQRAAFETFKGMVQGHLDEMNDARRPAI